MCTTNERSEENVAAKPTLIKLPAEDMPRFEI